MLKRIKLLLLLLLLSPVMIVNLSHNKIQAQDIPELHMIIYQGDVMMSGSFAKTSSLDGFKLEARILGETIGSTVIGENLTGRFSGLEIGPRKEYEGETVEFWIGNEKSTESDIFGPITPSGDYCPGCTWSLPLSRSINLHFNSIPQPTPTPIPASVEPSFLTGSIIFGSVLSAPTGISDIEAFIDGELVGKGSVNGPDFSITIDPGNESYLGKSVIFKIAGYESKTKYIFAEEDFITSFKLFFPEYIPPTATPTPVVPTAIPTLVPTPEPTRTPTAVPQPTATYTPTATPTPIVISTSSDSSGIILEDSDSGGCNSRGGGAASLSLIILSAAPLYLLNRRKRKS